MQKSCLPQSLLSFIEQPWLREKKGNEGHDINDFYDGDWKLLLAVRIFNLQKCLM